MTKPPLHRAIEKQRKAAVPQVGATVYVPHPIPLMAYPDDGDSPPVPVPNGQETWARGRVQSVERLERSVDPDDYLATVVLDDHPAIPVSVPVIFLRDI